MSSCLQSPERLQKTLESMQQVVEHERTLAASAERQGRELQARIEMVAKVRRPSLLALTASSESHLPFCVPLLFLSLAGLETPPPRLFLSSLLVQRPPAGRGFQTLAFLPTLTQ